MRVLLVRMASKPPVSTRDLLGRELGTGAGQKVDFSGGVWEGLHFCRFSPSCLYTQAETRAEFAERSVAQLEKTIDDLEGKKYIPLYPRDFHNRSVLPMTYLRSHETCQR